MAESYIQQLFAERIGGASYGKNTPIYKFERIKRAKTAARATHPDVEILDFGVGEPDEPPPAPIIRRLATEATRPENRGYTDNGVMEFREAVSRWMDRICGVRGLNPQTEIIHSIGSKAALTLLPACFINPGDVVLMTTPGYPVFGTHSKYYGGEVFNYKLTAENNFLPDLDSVPADVLRRAKALVINYPNNPTGASASPDFFARVVDFAKRNNLIVIHDAAYAALVFEGKPLSFLATPGAREVGVELFSMSKACNMTGWRLGWVCGNPLIVRAYGDVKDNSDSGQWAAIQKACAFALDHPEFTKKIAAKYSRRMNLLCAALNKIGFSAKKPKGSFFLYVKAPKAAVINPLTRKAGEGQGEGGHRIEFKTAEDVSQWLITEKCISTVPWDDAGAYLRWSVTFGVKGKPSLATERRVIAELQRRLADVRFEF